MFIIQNSCRQAKSYYLHNGFTICHDNKHGIQSATHNDPFNILEHNNTNAIYSVDIL